MGSIFHTIGNIASLGLMDVVDNTILGKKKSYSDQPWRKALADYETKVNAADTQSRGAYAKGEQVNRTNLESSTKEAGAVSDVNLARRGLYNTTMADTGRTAAMAGKNAGLTGIAGQRAAFEGTLRPDPNVYEPMIAETAANPGKVGKGSADLGKQYDERNTAALDAGRGAFAGAGAGITANSAKANAGTAGSLRARGIFGAGTQTAASKRIAEQTALDTATNQQAEGSTINAVSGSSARNATRPDPYLSGQLIQQIANKPVKQNGLRQAVGALAPIAGSVVGGIFGGPGGAAIGGALGGIKGAEIGGADAGANGLGGSNNPWQGAMGGLGMSSMFGSLGSSGGGGGGTNKWASWFSGGGSQPQVAGQNSGVFVGSRDTAAYNPPRSPSGGATTPAISGGQSVYDMSDPELVGGYY